MTPLLETKVDKAITLAMARAIVRHSKSKSVGYQVPYSESRTIAKNVSKALLPETTAAWHAIIVKLLSGGAIEPVESIKLDMISPQQLINLSQLYEAVGAIGTYWQCHNALRPWTDEELYMPTLMFTQRQFCGETQDPFRY